MQNSKACLGHAAIKQNSVNFKMSSETHTIRDKRDRSHISLKNYLGPLDTQWMPSWHLHIQDQETYHFSILVMSSMSNLKSAVKNKSTCAL